jgi:ABC-type transporter Mla subunit MlaD
MRHNRIAFTLVSVIILICLLQTFNDSNSSKIGELSTSTDNLVAESGNSSQVTLKDICITVKTTKSYERRVELILKTWFQLAPKQVNC